MSAVISTQKLQEALQQERAKYAAAESRLKEKIAGLQHDNSILVAKTKELEEQLRQQTQQAETAGLLATVADESMVPMVRMTREGKLIAQNKAASSLQPLQYKGQLYEAAQFWQALAHEVRLGGQETCIVAHSGELVFSFSCIASGTAGHLSVYGTNISPLQNALNAKEENEQKWQTALRASGDGIWEYDLKTKEIAFSRNYKDLLGFEKDTFLNQERLWRSRIHPDDIHLIDTMLSEYATGQRKQHATQYRIRKRSGNYIWILDRGLLLDQENSNRPPRIIGVHTNINQQKELELNVMTTANRLSTLVANLHIGIMMEDERGGVLITNKKLCNVLGIDFERQKHRRDNLLTMVRQNSELFCTPDLFLEGLEKTLEAQRSDFGEKWEMTDGRFIKLNFIPVRGQEGSFQGNMWVIEDMTDQVNNERALKQQRRFYEQILNNIPADVAVYDTEQHYIFINPAALKKEMLNKGLFATEEDEKSGYYESLSAAFDERTLRFNEVLQQKQLVSWEEEVVQPNGKKEFSLRTLFPVTNGGGEVDLVISYGLNITQRKEIEHRIILSEKKYRDLINYSYALIITHDVHGNLLSVNPAVCRTLGYTYSELLGKNIGEFMLPGDAERLPADYLQKINSECMAEGVFRVVNKNGTIIYLLYKNYLFWEEGESAYVIGFAHDITERIKAEKELRLAKKATEEAAVAKERFLADMSHEIRTPMNGILGLASLLERTALDNKQQELLGLLKESANNLLMIVNDVLDLEKIVSGKMELEQIAFPVLEKVGSSVAAFRFKIEEKGLALRHVNDVPADLLVAGDPYRLSQILNNLLSNALKFTDEGSITLTTRMVQRAGSQVTIEYAISDTGIGIPADKLEQIFNPYMQARPEISRKYGGTGLGLAICKSLVEMQKGSMNVESVEGRGSLFSFCIPYAVAAALPDQNVSLPVEQTDFLDQCRILVAEDVQINQYLIRHFFAGLQCSLSFVDNGREAVAEALKNEYDLILMDIQMPEMDGMEATRLIRSQANPQKAGIPIIALTANALKGADTKYLTAGMDNYVSKPYTKEKLLQTIKQTLLQSNRRRSGTIASSSEQAAARKK